MNMLPTIIAKSDQVNADDLIGGPRTITITKVAVVEGDQPVSIYFEGDDGKPFKPCKTCRRILVQVWGEDANVYPGRRLTIYRDDRVQFGGQAVGGIRISHVSDIDRERTLALMVTRGKRAPYTVKPLNTGGRRAASPPPAQQQADTGRRDQADGGDFPGDQGKTAGPAAPEPLSLTKRADMLEERLKGAPNTTKLNAVWNANGALRADLERGDPERLEVLTTLYKELDATLGEGPI